jgi:hypothetical protein
MACSEGVIVPKVEPTNGQQPTKAVVFVVRLDTYFPLPETPFSYEVKEESLVSYQVSWQCTHYASDDARVASVGISAAATIHPGPGTRFNVAAPVSDIQIGYEFPVPVSDAFLDKFFGSPIWRFSQPGMDRILSELNRIIDLYRIGDGLAYLTDYVSYFNFAEYRILTFAADRSPIYQSWGTGKTIASTLPIVDANQIASGSHVDFYFRLYLNSRKAYAEGRFLQMQVECSGFIEAAAKRVYSASKSLSSKTRGTLSNKELDYRGRFSEVGRVLHEAGFRRVSKPKISDLLQTAMHHRNSAMHGNESDVSRTQAEAIMQAAHSLAAYIYDALVFIANNKTTN